ncbi:hypothetical protein CZ674_05280 [Agrococcus casei LMG 22410]|uniref:Uncharacterized protein n=1 Tax=Agrococcus casei LMG 22410 TaxID=1255656 RepID=A0A1R4FMD3_9MICO|nr:hypothetical protein CZ674_05280 [Agrococcus casei LMG 22410]
MSRGRRWSRIDTLRYPGTLQAGRVACRGSGFPRPACHR